MQKAELKDILTPEQWKKASTITVNMLQSVYLQNEAGKNFSTVPLPKHAQLSALQGIVVADIDGDGNKDLITSGNFYPLRAQMGPLDAAVGLCTETG